jgi:hypothetical protein
MTSPLWQRASELATALAETSHFRSFRRAFDGRDDFTSRVSEITARYSPIRSDPILLGLRLSVLPDTEELLLSDADRQWLKMAVEAGAAFQVLIEGVRSELPGYPVLRVPHLRQGSPFVANDPIFVDGFPWAADLRRLGLQRMGPPPMNSLGGADLVDGQRQLRRELKQQKAWQRFVSAHEALTGADRESLSQLGKAFSALVRPDVVEREAGDLLIARHQFRRRQLEHVVTETRGRVREYLDAFEDVDLLITILASFIGTFVVNNGLEEVTPIRLALKGPGDIRDVDFVVSGDNPFLNPSEVLVMSTPDPGASGVVYPTAITHKWGRLDDPEGSRMIITGKLVA